MSLESFGCKGKKASSEETRLEVASFRHGWIQALPGIWTLLWVSRISLTTWAERGTRRLKAPVTGPVQIGPVAPYTQSHDSAGWALTSPDITLGMISFSSRRGKVP